MIAAYRILFGLTFFLLFLSSKGHEETNMTEYLKMPSILKLDDYDTCLYHNPDGNGIYCLSYVEVVPNTTSENWRIIEKYSSLPRHRFRHDILFIGTCIKRCKDLANNLDEQELNEFYVGSAQHQEIVDHYALVHDNLEYRKAYDELINKCLNHEYQHKYELKLRSNIEYCIDSSKEQLWDTAHFIFLIILASIVCLCIFSTGYDYYLKFSATQDNGNAFFTTKFITKKDRLLTAFSLKRNYLKLHSNTRGTDDDLNFLNGIRTVFNTLVIHAHIVMGLITRGSTNEIFFETYQLNNFTSFSANCGRIVNGMFFLMSTFLLKISFEKKSPITPKSSWRSCVGVFWKFLIYRYLRLVPGYALIILYNASFYGNQIDSPTWKHLTGQDHKFARINWWKNLLFINNWSLIDSTMPITWYLAADMQIFIIFLIVLIIIAKKPHFKKLIYGILFLFSLLYPAILLIIYKIQYHAGFLMLYYQIMFMTKANDIENIGMTPLTKIDICLLSIITAEIYLKLKANIKRRSYKGVFKYELGCWISFMMFYGFLNINYNSENYTIGVLMAMFNKNIIFFFGCIVILAFSMKLGGFIRNILSSNSMLKNARISYPVYLWHAAVLRIIMSLHKQPADVNNLTIPLYFFLTISISNMVATIVAIVFEYPIAEIVNSFIGTTPKITEKSKSK
ncbi:nose resistant to fluoxetine protein 6-like [Teleopsis dalmanni]|uniref:nose resistant to fluoxetine protein 6-like n=1 Tax=Teleopsis dalmanni TaxID=139649 RepID=UPI0018CD1350|nr:nose resistant to fluoxetine protein 6-like [Teleopsis dalmanni]